MTTRLQHPSATVPNKVKCSVDFSYVPDQLELFESDDLIGIGMEADEITAGGPFKPAFGLSGAVLEIRETRGQEVRRFSTAPHTIFPVLVTNNLDRAYRRRKLEPCAKHLIHKSAQGLRSNPAASPLRLTPCPGIFCLQLISFQYFTGQMRDLRGLTAIESMLSAGNN